MAMSSFSFHLSNLLDKMTSSDKDYRFMACNDLISELQKDSIKLDDEFEKKVVKQLLKLLEDKSGEVQNLAVKCLGLLVLKVKESQVEVILDQLCNNMTCEREELRDISSIGLKTVIAELPSSSANLVVSSCKKTATRLVKVINKSDVSVQLEALDILSDMLSRFGPLLTQHHEGILDALIPQLKSSRLAVRKRAIIAIGHLSMSCSTPLFSHLIQHLRTGLEKNENISYTRTYIQCVAAVSRQAGGRVGEVLPHFLPLLLASAQVEDDELREFSVQALDSFVRRCPKEIHPYLSDIISLCLKYLCYDPNYNYDDDDDAVNRGDQMDMEDQDDDDDGNDDDEYSDDDMSWKVRRASTKCLESVIASRHDLLVDLYKTVSPQLISRFKEREENVKSDIFHTYITLLKQTRPLALVGGTWTSGDEEEQQEETALQLLAQQVPLIVKSLPLRERAVKTRQGCLSLLTELTHVLPHALEGHMMTLVPGIHYSLGEKSSTSNMKIDTLCFLHSIMSTHSPQVFHPHIHTLLPYVVRLVGDQFYKITSEALQVLQQIVRVIRPLDTGCKFDYKPYVPDIYKSTLVRLKAADIDQEVKERAISCMGQVIANLGDELANELTQCLQILLERLKNEITRLITVKSLTRIASSRLRIDITTILPEAVPILASFLRKNHRALKLSSLECLDVIVRNYGTHINDDSMSSVVNELPPLISESDLHVSHYTLTLLTTVSGVRAGLVGVQCLTQVYTLTRSPLLQG